ncbi:MAG: efflux RND transporter periplasmic adaptor subunit [Acidobacteria bacterium]|nr:efflux RND transporter periplasmic adaptor subunit [Acidobacteriota bacterium]
MKRRLFSISLLLMATVAGACGGRSVDQTAERPVVVTEVPTDVVRPVSIAWTFEAPGVVRARTSTVISSKVPGIVVGLRVREGERVRTGQLLVEIDSRNVRAQLDKAQAGLLEAQGQSGELELNLRAAQAAEVSAGASQRLALATLKRYELLRERRSVSDQEFDEVDARARVAAAEVDRAEKMRQMVEARRQVVEARIAQARADVAAAQVAVGDTRIVAPFDGIIVAKPAEIGALAAPGVPLLTIEGGRNLRLEVEVEQSRIGEVTLDTATKVRFDLPAFAAGGMEMAGKVAEILPAADPVSRTFTVRIDLPVSSAIRSGQFGRALFAGAGRETLMVPVAAVVARGQLTSLYAVDEGGIVHQRLITVGRKSGDQVEVLSGLRSGEKIITAAARIEREGIQIR